MRPVLILLSVLLFACTAFAETPGCGFRTELLNNADPALTPDQLAMGEHGFERVAEASNPVVEARSETGVMWLRISAVDANCDASAWMRAKYPYVTKFRLFALKSLSDGADRYGPAHIHEIGALPFMYPAWPLALEGGHQADTYLLRIAYPDKLILPLRISSPGVITGEAAIFGLISLSLIILLFAQALQACLIGSARARPENVAFVGFTTSAGIYILVSSGILHQLLAPSIEFDVKNILLASQSVLVWSAVEFFRTSSRGGALAKLNPLLRALQFTAALTIIAPYLLPPLAAFSFQFAFLYAPLIMFAVLIWNAAKGGRAEIGLVLAWSPTLLATVWIFGRLLGLTSYLEINHHIVGIALFATSLRFNAILGSKYRADAYAASHDSLTGLPNRRAMEAAAARYENGQFTLQALAMLDLSKFKAVNDTYGHSAGDAALAQIGRCARQTLSKGTQLYRIGGDEFVLMVEAKISRPEFEKLLQQLSERIAEPVSHNGKTFAISVHVGAVFGPIPAGTPFGRVLNRADVLAYKAKSQSMDMVALEAWNADLVEGTDSRAKDSGILFWKNGVSA